MTNVLLGQGIHGAMLHEAGLPWRTRDDGAAAAIIEICSGGGPLAKGGAYKIVPDFSNASINKSGSFEVEDRQSLTPLGRVGPIDRKHLLPNENGFAVDEAAEIEKATKGGSRRAVQDSKADIKLARALHSKRHPDEDVDPDTEAMREMHRKNPPPDRAGHGAATDMNSIGSVVSFEDLLYADRSTRQRAIDEFGITACELASSRFRALLSKVADFLDNKTDEQRDTTATIPAAQITQRDGVPFDVGIFEDAVFTELETVTIHH